MRDKIEFHKTAPLIFLASCIVASVLTFKYVKVEHFWEYFQPLSMAITCLFCLSYLLSGFLGAPSPNEQISSAPNKLRFMVLLFIAPAIICACAFTAYIFGGPQALSTGFMNVLLLCIMSLFAFGDYYACYDIDDVGNPIHQRFFWNFIYLDVPFVFAMLIICIASTIPVSDDIATHFAALMAGATAFQLVMQNAAYVTSESMQLKSPSSPSELLPLVSDPTEFERPHIAELRSLLSEGLIAEGAENRHLVIWLMKAAQTVAMNEAKKAFSDVGTEFAIDHQIAFSRFLACQCRRLQVIEFALPSDVEKQWTKGWRDFLSDAVLLDELCCEGLEYIFVSPAGEDDAPVSLVASTLKELNVKTFHCPSKNLLDGGTPIPEVRALEIYDDDIVVAYLGNPSADWTSCGTVRLRLGRLAKSQNWKNLVEAIRRYKEEVTLQ